MTNKEAIYRQDVLDLAKKGVLISNGSYKSVCKAINELPPVNPQPCEDAISRQAVIDMISDAQILSDESGEYCGYCTEDIDIESIPPVNPTNTGQWIDHPEIETSTPEYLMFYECSECGDRQCFCKSDIHKKRFCSNCGCRMVEPQERSGEE